MLGLPPGRPILWAVSPGMVVMAVPPRPIVISVIVPCRNAADVLGAQMQALARQRCDVPWEVVIVDNGSTDNTRAVAERYRTKVPQLTIVDANQCRGAAYARNVGAHAARGLNIAFCDADDEVDGGWLAAVADALRDHQAIAFRTDTAKLNDGVAERTIRQSDGLQLYTYPPYLPYSGSTIAMRRELFFKLGGFDETMLACEDADLCWRVQHAGVPLYFARDAVVHVRLRSSLSAMCRQARLWGEYNVVLYKKYRPLGMPALKPLQGLRSLVGTLRRFPQLGHRRTRSEWLWEASWMVGRVVGSLKHRTWAL
jgi:glycosyltransferase involved in cell wall biosynthesis